MIPTPNDGSLHRTAASLIQPPTAYAGLDMRSWCIDSPPGPGITGSPPGPGITIDLEAVRRQVRISLGSQSEIIKKKDVA